MNKTIIFICLITSVLAFTCKSTKDMEEETNNEQQVETTDKISTTKVDLQTALGWKWKDRPPLEEGGKDYIIQFKPDGKLRVRLDANNCFGGYNMPDMDGKIVIGKDLACTEMCCDKEHAGPFIERLSRAYTYVIRGNMLKLGDGEDELIFEAVVED